MSKRTTRTRLDAEAARLYRENRHKKLYKLAKDNWPALDKKLPPRVSEVCRYAMIRTHEEGKIETHLWRARALTGAVLSRNRETGAGLLLHGFFLVVALARVQPLKAQKVRAYKIARAILEEMKRLVPVGSREWNMYVGELYHGKLGFALLREATSENDPAKWARKRLKEAVREFKAALVLTKKGGRGALKLMGYVKLAEYLMLGTAKGNVRAEQDRLCEETSRIREEAKKAGYKDVERWAGENEKVMRGGGYVGWKPYDVE